MELVSEPNSVEFEKARQLAENFKASKVSSALTTEIAEHQKTSSAIPLTKAQKRRMKGTCTHGRQYYYYYYQLPTFYFFLFPFYFHLSFLFLFLMSFSHVYYLIKGGYANSAFKQMLILMERNFKMQFLRDPTLIVLHFLAYTFSAMIISMLFSALTANQDEQLTLCIGFLLDVPGIQSFFALPRRMFLIFLILSSCFLFFFFFFFIFFFLLLLQFAFF